MTINWYAFSKEEEKLAKRKGESRKGEFRKLPEVVVFSADGTTLTADGVLYRQIPGYENYYISKKMEVKNQLGRTLRNRQTSNNSKLKIRVGGEDLPFYRHELFWMAWPELAPINMPDGWILWQGVRWKFIEGYEGLYILSEQGIVRNYKRWAIMKTNGFKRNRVYLFKDGKQRAYALDKLLQTHFPSYI